MNCYIQALLVYILQWQALLERDTANSRSNKLFGRSRNLRKIRSAVCQSIRIIRQLHWASGNFHIIQVSDSEQTHQETQLAHHPTRCIIECDDELYLGLLVTLQYSHLSAVLCCEANCLSSRSYRDQVREKTGKTLDGGRLTAAVAAKC